MLSGLSMAQVINLLIMLQKAFVAIMMLRLELRSKRDDLIEPSVLCSKKKIAGDVRESNPGPLAPKARIIPLDQHPLSW